MPTASDTITLPDVLCEVVTALPCRGAQEVRNYSVDANALLGENESITENWSVACNDPTVTVKPVSVASGVVTFTVSGGVSNHISAIRLFLPLSTGEVRTPILSMMTEPQGLVGTATETKTIGDDGLPGLSAYELAVEAGFTGTKEEWLASLTPNAQTKLPTTANPTATLGEAVDKAFAAIPETEKGAANGVQQLDANKAIAVITQDADATGNITATGDGTAIVSINSSGTVVATTLGAILASILNTNVAASTSLAAFSKKTADLSADGTKYSGDVTDAKGGVKTQAAPASLTAAPTADDFNNLVTLLKSAGVLRAS